ncbi:MULTISPECIES: hypothetical protein [unclassified Legionella]|uniref:hypothetical protein n=1 Tax=unclassified Legionella TaxID=2622702 RepID=UPI003AF986DF
MKLILKILLALSFIKTLYKRAEKKKDFKRRMNTEAVLYSFKIDNRNAKVVPLISMEAQRFSEVNSSYEDIKFAKDCLKLTLNEERPIITYLNFNEDRNPADLIYDALYRAAIMSYARTFVSTDSGRSQLGIDVFDVKEKKIHDELMKIRHTYLAHAGYAEDEQAYEFIGTYLLLDPENMATPEIYAHNRRANGFPKEKTQEYLLVIEKLLTLYEKKLKKMRKSLYRKVIKDS